MEVRKINKWSVKSCQCQLLDFCALCVCMPPLQCRTPLRLPLDSPRRIRGSRGDLEAAVSAAVLANTRRPTATEKTFLNKLHLPHCNAKQAFTSQVNCNAAEYKLRHFYEDSSQFKIFHRYFAHYKIKHFLAPWKKYIEYS